MISAPIAAPAAHPRWLSERIVLSTRIRSSSVVRPHTSALRAPPDAPAMPPTHATSANATGPSTAR
jgi:hypothetical protein